LKADIRSLHFIQLASSSSSSDVITRCLWPTKSPLLLLRLLLLRVVAVAAVVSAIAVAKDMSRGFLDDVTLLFFPGVEVASGLTRLRGAPWAVTRCFRRYHLFFTTFAQRVQVTPCDWICTLTMCCFKLNELVLRVVVDILRKIF